MATKKTNTLIAAIVGLIAVVGAVYVINPGSDGGVFKPDCSAYKPGDTLDMRGKKYSYAYFDGLKGTVTDSITILADGAMLSAGFDFNNCQYVRARGFTVDQGGTSVSRVAISIHGKSKGMHFSNFKIINCGYGVWLKNEHEDLKDTSVSSWVLDGFTFNDFEMSRLFSHGFYAGATEYPNKTRPVVINGVSVYPNPSMLGNIKIYNGYIHNVGRNGVMLCLAKYGKNEVFNMTIDTTGREKNQDQQGSGLQFGGFTSVYAYDNNVNHTLLWGIRSFGGDTVRIENNKVNSSGNNGDTVIKWAQNIAVGPDASYTVSGSKMFFSIKGNTISNPGSGQVSNIQVWKGSALFSDKNEICANGSATVTADAGIVYVNTCSVVPTPIPNPTPTPTKEIFHKGYWSISGKRIYYVIYSDGTWAQTNSKYVPL